MYDRTRRFLAVRSHAQTFTRSTKVFDFRLKWGADLTPPMTAASPEVAAAVDAGPTLSTAVEQLGLKLEKRKLPVGVLVLDHVERTPVEN